MIVDARCLFDDMPERDIMLWITNIARLVEAMNSDLICSFDLEGRYQMPVHECWQPWFVTTGLGYIFAGKQLNSYVLKLGFMRISVSCFLIDM